MSKYELLYILDRDLVEEKREELIAKLKSLVEEKGGEVISVDKWGMKKLAYAINYKNDGFYVLMTLTLSNASAVDEMSKLMNITDGLVRHMFVKKEN